MQKKDALFFNVHNDRAHSIRIIVKIDKKSATCYYLISKYHYNFPKITEGKKPHCYGVRNRNEKDAGNVCVK